MEWIDFKKNPPKENCVCWVANRKWGIQVLRAYYQKDFDVFLLRTPEMKETIWLDVTHYIVEPDVLKVEWGEGIENLSKERWQ